MSNNNQKRNKSMAKRQMRPRDVAPERVDGSGIVADVAKPRAVFRYRPSGQVPEKKTNELLGTGTGVNAGGISFTLNAPTQGVGAQQRIGQKVIFKRLGVSGYVSNSVANLNTAGFQGGSDLIRVCLVYDKQSNGTTVAYNDVFNVGGGNAASPCAERSITYLDRYIVLAETKLTISATGTTLARFDFIVDCDLETRYNTINGGTFADITTGNISLLFANVNTLVSTTNCVFYSKVCFVDE